MRLDRKPAAGRVLTGISHGGHVLTDDSPEAARLAATHEGITALEAAVSEAEVVDNTTPFDYLFPEVAAQFPGKHLPNDNPAAVVAALKALGSAMVEDPPPAADPLQPLANSTIPPVYTYWGQFIDHDITANTDRDSELSDITRPNLTPLQPAVVAEQLRNLRHPALNLDSVYGDGPTLDSQSPTEAADLYDGIKLKVGTAAAESNDPDSPIRGVRIPPDDDLERDLPRVDKKARIGDDRNDENLIIAQFHLAFLRFHNATVDWVLANEPDTYGGDAGGVFDRARQLVRWQYQWLVVHDYLKTVTLSGVADKVLLGGNKHYEPREGEVYMPLEFSVAGSGSGTAWSGPCTTTTATSAVAPTSPPTRRFPAVPVHRQRRPAVRGRHRRPAVQLDHRVGPVGRREPASPTSSPARSRPAWPRRCGT